MEYNKLNEDYEPTLRRTLQIMEYTNPSVSERFGTQDKVGIDFMTNPSMYKPREGQGRNLVDGHLARRDIVSFLGKLPKHTVSCSIL